MHFTFCPHCGDQLVPREIGDEGLIPYCERCRVPLWDLFTTGVIAAVVNTEGEVALLRQGYVSADKYVCVAGIMKPGESAEAAVAREVLEEIGQEAEAVEYVASYPYEKKEMLMLGFRVTVRKRELRLSGEVDAAAWVRAEDALSLMREGSIAWQLVRTATEGMRHAES